MIQRFINFLLSVKFASILLLILAALIGFATFIENDFGRSSSKALIYNTWWFDFIFVLLVSNLFNNLKRYRLFSIKKIPVLIFHFAFIIIILGAGVTRYFGFEGMMHIRENQSSNVIVSDDVFLQFQVHKVDLV